MTNFINNCGYRVVVFSIFNFKFGVKYEPGDVVRTYLFLKRDSDGLYWGELASTQCDVTLNEDEKQLLSK